MIIFLYGPDTYRSKQKLNEIIEHYKKIHQSGLNLKFFDEENLNFQSLKDTLFSTPIFKEKKLLVLKNIFSNQNFKENFLKEKERFINSEDIFLIYEKKEISKDDPLFQFLKKNSKFQEFNLLDNQKLKNWIKEELEKKDAQISPKALEKLIEYVGNNLWRVSNEIKKLVSYKKGEIIQEKDIELLVKPKIETDIFKTINAIAEKKKDKALILLHQHLEKGDSPLYLLFMINFQFRYLLIVKEMIEKNIPYYIILNQIKLPSFVVRKILEQSKKFTLQQLKKIYQKIFQKDLQIKTGKIEPETALDILIAEI
jgi:DNA polymerase-3 subunit delta